MDDGAGDGDDGADDDVNAAVGGGDVDRVRVAAGGEMARREGAEGTVNGWAGGESRFVSQFPSR